MRLRPALAVTLLLAAVLPVALPTAVTAVVAVHLTMHHHAGHPHEGHHHADHPAGREHRHRLDAAAEPERPATRPFPPSLPTVTAAALPVVSLPVPATLDLTPAAPWIERRGPPPPLLHLHCSLLL